MCTAKVKVDEEDQFGTNEEWMSRWTIYEFSACCFFKLVENTVASATAATVWFGWYPQVGKDTQGGDDGAD